MKAPDRVAFSPGEFASLFGKSQTWGYRQIYAGKVKAITEHGRMLIPAVEVESILQSAGIYDGLKAIRVTAAKSEVGKELMQNVWAEFIAQRRAGVPPKEHLQDGEGQAVLGSSRRQQALDRLARKRT